MKIGIHRPGVPPGNAPDGRQLPGVGCLQRRKAPQCQQQLFGLGRADARDDRKRRGGQGFALGRLHAAQGVAVHLLLNPVNQRKHVLLPGNADFLLRGAQRAGFVVIVLDHAEHRDFQPQPAQQLPHGRYVPPAAVQQNQVGGLGKGARCVREMGQPARERLTHGGVIVGSLHGTDAEAAVIRLAKGPVPADNHAGREMLGAEIGDVVGLDALGIGLQREQPGQAHQRPLLGLGIHPVALGLLGRVLLDQCAQGVQGSTLGGVDVHPPPGQRGEHLREHPEVLGVGLKGQQHLRRDVGAELVVLGEKRGHILGLQNAVGAEQKVLAVVQHSGADAENRDAGAEIVGIQRHHILLGIGRGNHLLLFAQGAQRAQGIAAARGGLKVLLFRKPQHVGLQPAAHRLAAPPQQLGRIAHRLPVFLGRHLPGAYPAAAVHLVINAGAALADVARKDARTVGQPQRAVDQLNQRIGRARARIRAEVAGPVGVAPACEDQPGVFPGGNLDIRIGLGVLEADVVFGGVLLDQGVLQRESLHLVVAEVIIEIPHGRDHARGFRIFVAVLKILRHPALEPAGFADINHPPAAIPHQINPRSQGQRIGFFQQSPPDFFVGHGAPPPAQAERAAQFPAALARESARAAVARTARSQTAATPGPHGAAWKNGGVPPSRIADPGARRSNDYERGRTPGAPPRGSLPHPAPSRQRAADGPG